MVSKLNLKQFYSNICNYYVIMMLPMFCCERIKTFQTAWQKHCNAKKLPNTLQQRTLFATVKFWIIYYLKFALFTAVFERQKLVRAGGFRRFAKRKKKKKNQMMFLQRCDSEHWRMLTYRCLAGLVSADTVSHSCVFISELENIWT